MRKCDFKPRRHCSLICIVFMALFAGGTLFHTVAEAAPPAGYYDAVNTSSPATLRATLHEVIDDHTRYPYSSSSTDTWDILEEAQQDPNNSGRIIDAYGNQSIAKIGGGSGPYNREHSWPKSYGFPDDNSSNYCYTDCFQLFLCDSGYNSSRGNKPFDYCAGGCSEYPTDANNGQGGGTGSYPGNSNWSTGSSTSGEWEVWIGKRGDIARAQFYMDVRYEGGTHGITGASEPDLILTDNLSLIASSSTGQNLSVAYMGLRSVLLQWHQQDPVDDWERQRNDVVYSYQGNRNPFIDHPEWVDCIFNSNCTPGSGAPAAPVGVVATAGDGSVALSWSPNFEPDLDGYNVHRSTSSGGPYTQLNAGLLATTNYTDASVFNGVTYHYVVTAVNTSSQESAVSAEVNATPQSNGTGSEPGLPWINEFHYDNSGGDTGEFVEIAGPAGTDLSNWLVVGYNGNGGGTYNQVTLSGVIPDQGGCMGTLAFDFNGMQNGSPDGLALVDPSDNVVQFLSYEGTLSGSNGPAAGMMSTDIGVSEQPAPPVGDSLQVAGTGAAYEDFSWSASGPATRGTPNTGQTFNGCASDTTAPVAPMNLVAAPSDNQVALGWTPNSEPDLEGYLVYRALDAGGPYTLLTLTPIATASYVDTSAVNCSSYHYVVTAIDDSGNESNDSNEAMAIPSSGADGDMNDDLIVDGRDIQPFLDALLSTAPAADAICHGDFDGFNGIDFADISLMVDALLAP